MHKKASSLSEEAFLPGRAKRLCGSRFGSSPAAGQGPYQVL